MKIALLESSLLLRDRKLGNYTSVEDDSHRDDKAARQTGDVGNGNLKQRHEDPSLESCLQPSLATDRLMGAHLAVCQQGGEMIREQPQPQPVDVEFLLPRTSEVAGELSQLPPADRRLEGQRLARCGGCLDEMGVGLPGEPGLQRRRYHVALSTVSGRFLKLPPTIAYLVHYA